MESYLINFATVLKNETSYSFQLDNKKNLIPKELKNYSGKEGQRVLLNYTLLSSDTIKVRSISDIFTASIQTKGFPENLKQDPVNIQSIWVDGNYLNMILEVEYHSKSHTAGLYRNNASPTVDLHFSYSRNDDPRGSSKLFYASFLLTSLKDTETSSVPFRLLINTHEGIREFQMKY